MHVAHSGVGSVLCAISPLHKTQPSLNPKFARRWLAPSRQTSAAWKLVERVHPELRVLPHGNRGEWHPLSIGAHRVYRSPFGSKLGT